MSRAIVKLLDLFSEFDDRFDVRSSPRSAAGTIERTDWRLAV